jgi:hypothetical protein
MTAEKKPLFSFTDVQAQDVLQVLVEMNTFVLVQMVGRDIYRNPHSTILQTLKDNIKDSPALSDDARQIANAIVEACEISIKVELDALRGGEN